MKSNDIDNYFNSLTETSVNALDLTEFDKINSLLLKNKSFLEGLSHFISKNKDDFITKFNKDYQKYESDFKFIPMLIGVRDLSKKVILKDKVISFEEIVNDKEKLLEFILETRLINVFTNHMIGDLFGYYFGIEVGLDTNSRKNRYGKKIETIIFSMLRYYCEINNIVLKNQIKVNDIDIPGFKNKIFDFVLYDKLKDIHIMIECSFYNSGGSKISETARSYENLNSLLKNNKKFKFIWLADGQGMKTIKNILKKDSIDFVTNINNLINQINKYLGK